MEIASTKPAPHQSLIRSLQSVTIDQLMVGQAGMAWKMDLVKIQSVTDLATARVAKKIFLVKNELGQELIEKMVCAVFVAFSDGLKVTTDKPDAVEIFEMATLFLETHTHESISDLVLCLKMVKQGKFGTIYNRFDMAVFNELWNKYLDWKYNLMEAENNSFEGPINTPLHKKMYLDDKRDRQAKNEAIKAKVDEYFKNRIE